MLHAASRVLLVVLTIATGAGHAFAMVTSVDGMAISRQGEEGWKPLEAGAAITSGMEIRLQEKSRIVSGLGGRGSWAALGPATITIGRAGEAGEDNDREIPEFDFDLKRGHLAVLHQPENKEEQLLFETVHGRMIAGPGVFSILSDGKGKTEIASGKGKICFHHGKKKCAEEGEILILRKTPQGPESELKEVPPHIARFWVELNWPVAPRKPKLSIIRPQDGMFFSEPNIYVVGNTSPGSSVMVNKTEVSVKKNGSFSGTVSLYEGENTLEVQAISPEGGVETVSVTVHLDNTSPMLTISQPIDGFDPSTTGTCDQFNCYIQIFGLTEPGVSLIINGVNASRYIEDDGSFLIQDYPINRNARTLTIEVEDMLRQRTVEILHIMPPADSDGDGRPDNMDACPFDPICQ